VVPRTRRPIAKPFPVILEDVSSELEVFRLDMEDASCILKKGEEEEEEVDDVSVGSSVFELDKEDTTCILADEYSHDLVGEKDIVRVAR